MNVSENNKGYEYRPMNDANVIHYRLDTTQLLEELKDILLGQAPVYKKNIDGSIDIVKESVTSPLVNDKGFQMIYGLVRMCINNAVVQGATSDENYEFQVYDFETKLTTLLACNYEEWGITQSDRITLKVGLTTLFINFLSRTVDDGERKSYGTIVQARDSKTVENKGVFGGMFSK